MLGEDFAPFVELSPFTKRKLRTLSLYDYRSGAAALFSPFGQGPYSRVETRRAFIMKRSEKQGSLDDNLSI